MGLHSQEHTNIDQNIWRIGRPMFHVMSAELGNYIDEHMLLRPCIYLLIASYPPKFSEFRHFPPCLRDPLRPFARSLCSLPCSLPCSLFDPHVIYPSSTHSHSQTPHLTDNVITTSPAPTHPRPLFISLTARSNDNQCTNDTPTDHVKDITRSPTKSY